jgi:hypothetical protein
MEDTNGLDFTFGMNDPVEQIPVYLPIRDQYGSTWDSPGEAARALSLRRWEIDQQLAGKRHAVKGFRFSFAG